MKKQVKILFILKKRSKYGPSYGLRNSAAFVCHELQKLGVETKEVDVDDNNFIDKVVHDYKPTHVIIEALWVVPEKFPVLMKLHPTVKWFVRLHSQVPFLAHEGVAIGWLKGYNEISKINKNLQVSCNHKELQKALKFALGIDSVYTPNIYPFEKKKHNRPEHDKKIIEIACFGAIRPFKNQLQQALAAIIFADENDLTLNFHINHSRFENVGEGVLKNLRSTFSGLKHNLIGYDWSNHHDFLKVVRQMDIGMQVSFTETFNIVAADFVSQGISFVGSKEINWLHPSCQANPTDIDDIFKKLNFVYNNEDSRLLNEFGLELHNTRAIQDWADFLEIPNIST